MAQLAYEQQLITESCYVCAIQFAMPREFRDRRLSDKRDFYCPAGHPQHFIAKTEAEKLREQLAAREAELAAKNRTLEMERNTRRNAEVQATKAKNRLKKLTHRVECGVCPHCQRTFKQLGAHMRSKHGIKS